MFPNVQSRICRTVLALALVLPLWCLTAPAADNDRPLRVCASVPELGSLVRHIGGEAVEITVFAKGTEDPHHVLAKPGFIKALAKADLFLVVGMDLEIGWAPVLVDGSRNSRVRPDAPGYLDISKCVRPLDIPEGPVDRSMGDVHPGGNPHYLLDPLNGLKAAELIRARLAEIRPEQAGAFKANADGFRKRMMEKLLGEKLASELAPEDLLRHGDAGQLKAFLYERKELDGWFGRLRPFAGAKVVDDHGMWPYFTRTFGFQVAAHLEPLPGITPTTRHLKDVIDRMKSEKIAVLLTNAYYDPKSAEFVARNTGARIASMAHQCGARSETDDYVAMVDYNVNEIAKALEGGK